MKNMNHLVSLLQEGYNTIGVVFNVVEVPTPWAGSPAAPAPSTGRTYTYKCHFHCKVGDLVVVPPSSEGKLPSLATVTRVDDEPELNFEGDIEYKWAICKVDDSAYQTMLDRERELIKMLRDNERKVQRQQLLESYQLHLPSDPEGRKIFDAARQIGPTIKD